MGEEFCFMLGKIFRQSFYLLKLYQQKVFMLKLIYGKKWLVSCFYKPQRDNISNRLQTISKSLDLYLSQYDNIIIVGDFNTEIGETSMKAFCERYSLSSLIKEPTCYKNPANPNCIDLILTNSPRSFQYSTVIETGLPDFHRIIVTALKTTFQRLPPKINYRDYSNFDHGMFRTCLCNNLSKGDVGNLEKFIKFCINTLNNHALSKKKYTRGNHLPFMNKELSKAIMNRTRLRNVYLRKRSDENRKKHSKQRNYCVSLLGITKRNYYSSLDAKSVTDNKTFWRTVKPFLSDKTPFNAKITLIEDGEVISSDNEIANVLNTCFSNILSNLNLPEYPISNPYYDKIRDPVLKAILK